VKRGRGMERKEGKEREGMEEGNRGKKSWEAPVSL